MNLAGPAVSAIPVVCVPKALLLPVFLILRITESDMENLASPSLILWLVFAAAFVFGLIGQKTHFCTMGAVSDILNMEDWSRMRMWLLATAPDV